MQLLKFDRKSQSPLSLHACFAFLIRHRGRPQPVTWVVLFADRHGPPDHRLQLLLVQSGPGVGRGHHVRVVVLGGLERSQAEGRRWRRRRRRRRRKKRRWIGRRRGRRSGWDGGGAENSIYVQCTLCLLSFIYTIYRYYIYIVYILLYFCKSMPTQGWISAVGVVRH